MPILRHFTLFFRCAVFDTDISTEELAHLEMVSTIIHQFTKGLSIEEIEKSGLGSYYIDHTVGVWPQAAGGIPFNACEFQVKGNPVVDPLHFLHAREVVHFQRFGALEEIQEGLDAKNFYAFSQASTLL